ncbi:hypothetical protein AC482_05050 [miscellaneous Crenarchaeota group-15 archaeon DG-45]|uniref:Luciferase-like domain-containing protein n=1 Tax=miscellaneous Crenarchaeota group-15 archaeon DG-45 TaxID=1685127 RepID=A0A0M0BNU4_9ARCH|nr:MAG: hypothetical protein AC482_05050 [miscellaneous Crenarchaeota group-15 archaeon DG-45]
MRPELKFGVSLPLGATGPAEEMGFGDVLDYALKAEREGFDMVTVADHVFIRYEALSILSAVAAATEGIGVGTSVLDLNRRPPAVLAHATATLDQVSGGRLTLGVGRGVWNEATYGRPIERPVSRMREVIIVLKRFWTEDRVNHAGPFFSFRGASVAARPAQRPHPPIWIAAFGPRMLRIAGELGDGFVTQNLPPELFERDLREARESARDHGREPEEVAGVFAAPMAVAPEYDDALRHVEGTVRGALFRRGGPPWRFADRLGHGEPWEREEDVPLDLVDRCCIFGTPDDCIDKIEGYAERGASCFSALPLYPPGSEGLELFAREVIAYFRDG